MLQHQELSYYAIECRGHPTAALRHAKLVLRYLLLDADFHLPCNQYLKIYNFYDYCADKLFWHLSKLDAVEDEQIFELLHKFIFNAPNALRNFGRLAVHRCPLARGRLDSIKGQERYDSEITWSAILWFKVIQNVPSWYVKRIIGTRPSLLESDVLGRGPPLLIATMSAKPLTALALLRLGADVHNSHSPTLESISGTEYIPWWTGGFEGDSEPTWVGSGYRSISLMHAAARWCPGLVPGLLNYGANPNIRSDDGSLPIHYAVMGSNPCSLGRLVDAGADVNAESYSGKTPFHIALEIASCKIMDYLLDKGAVVPHDIDFSRTGPLSASLKERLLATPRSAGVLIPAGWIRGQEMGSHGTIREGLRTLGTFQPRGGVLKRMVFKTSTSRGDGTSMPIIPRYLYVPNQLNDRVALYGRLYPRMGASICKSDNSSDPAERPHCFIDEILCSGGTFIVTTLDVRNQMPWVREWLESIQPGDAVVVHALGWSGLSFSYKMTVDYYFEP